MGSMLLIVATASAFNLTCEGVETIAQWEAGKFSSKTLSERPFSTELRVDMQSKKWCAGECSITRDISSFDERRIVFEFEEDKKHEGSQLDLLSYVQRESGDYTMRRRVWVGTDLLITLREGNCVPAAFGGHPKRKF